MTLRDIREEVRRQQELGNLDAAAATLHQAIDATARHQELAELYGLLGGTRHRQGLLTEAVAAYDAGAQHESASSTYNELNRLVVRVLLDPRSLTDAPSSDAPAQAAPTGVADGLARLQDHLAHAVARERADDPWAVGDLAVTSALVGRATRAGTALARLAVLAPPHVLAKYRNTLVELAALDTPHRAVLAGLAEQLGRYLQARGD